MILTYFYLRLGIRLPVRPPISWTTKSSLTGFCLALMHCNLCHILFVMSTHHRPELFPCPHLSIVRSLIKLCSKSIDIGGWGVKFLFTRCWFGLLPCQDAFRPDGTSRCCNRCIWLDCSRPASFPEWLQAFACQSTEGHVLCCMYPTSLELVSFNLKARSL